jgi:hypothetical protein
VGVKKRNSFLLNWSTTSPIPFSPNAVLSGVTSGAMTGTSTIYSNIQDISNTDNQGLEVTWTGTPNGTISVLGSEGGTDFYSLTFDPPLGQPIGVGDGYIININQFPFRYLLVEYTNTSGSGSLTIWLGSKDVN